ncbi:MAG: MFS transporter [Nitrososphaerota archaeon]|nr:MFS transporter [Candidatus Bathyarchaeota archaeon]MDW8049076.1 MFS transporter [Nitrososphaerota archaeon]
MRRSPALLLVTVSALSALGVGLLGPVYPIFVLNRFSASIVDVGFLAAVFSLTAAVFKAPAGKIVDLVGKEKVLLAGVLLGAISSLSYIYAYNIMHLYLIEFLFGIAYALQQPSLLSLAIDLSNEEKRGFFLGILSSAYDLAGAVAALVSALIVAKFGFEAIFYMASGLHATTGIFVLKSRKI